MLKGERITLRRLERRDLPALITWDADAEIIEAMGKKFDTEARCEAWFERLADDPRRRVLAMEDERGRLIGELELDNLSPKAGTVELTICIGDRSCWDRGYGSEAVSLVRDHLFTRTRTRRIYLRVYRTNKRAIHCYEKCGFTKEGILGLSRRQIGRTGEVLLMSVTRPGLSAEDVERLDGKRHAAAAGDA